MKEARNGECNVKKLIPILCLTVFVLCGCARHYVITLNNGSRISTTSKPHLKNGNWVYKDAEGRQTSTPAGRVTEVAPASMATPSGAPVKSSN
jgi:hypothetical protein